MFANLFSQLDEAMKQLNRRGGSYAWVSSTGNSRISLFSSSSTPPVVTLSNDGSTIIVTSSN